MADIQERLQLRARAEHVGAEARDLCIGGEEIERVVGQEVVELQVGDAGIGAVGHPLQVDVAGHVSLAVTLEEQRVGCEL